MREEVQANPSMKPEEAHEKERREALQLAKEAGQTGKELDSIAVLFQPWQEVRNHYYRRRKMAGYR
uniref:Uncharacterized protein n=1 Tax=Ditylenchus dipsaci TaxID=166011 RepID=A0A915DMW7_9BILA